MPIDNGDHTLYDKGGREMKLVEFPRDLEILDGQGQAVLAGPSKIIVVEETLMMTRGGWFVESKILIPSTTGGDIAAVVMGRLSERAGALN
jgi:hypothetical protein